MTCITVRICGDTRTRTHTHTQTHAHKSRSLCTELDQDDEERKPFPQKNILTPVQNKERADVQDMTLSEWKQAFGDVIDSTILR